MNPTNQFKWIKLTWSHVGHGDPASVNKVSDGKVYILQQKWSDPTKPDEWRDVLITEEP